MQNFRDIPKAHEILQLMRDAPSTEKGQIWQTIEEERRVFDIVDIKDDDTNRALVFETSTALNLSKDNPVYIRINHRDLIFKLNSKSCVIKDNKLICVYPKVAKAIEERIYERFPVPKDKEFLVTLKPLGASASEINVRLKDFSRQGIGIIVSDINRDFIVKNVVFQIQSINSAPLPGYSIGTLRYTKRGRGGVHAGFSLATEFSDSVFEALTKLIIQGL